MSRVLDIRQLASLKDIDDNYDIRFEDVEEKKKHIQIIEKNRKANSVILATDDDREGEGIADICDALIDVSSTPRIVFQEITKSAIKSSI